MKQFSLTNLIDNFVLYKKSLGMVYNRMHERLIQYGNFMQTHYPDVVIPDKQSTETFLLTKGGKPGELANTISCLREFSKYLINIGFKEAYIIPSNQLPKYIPSPPYFISEQEVKLFFESCDTIFKDTDKRSVIFPALMRLLYCCGMRPKEARILTVDNVHLSDCYIDVLQSKGPYSRRIFISKELASYLEKYEARINLRIPHRVYFFPFDKDRPYASASMRYSYELIWNSAFPNWEGSPPKINVFRHHFAWFTINNWARNKEDVNALLPYLMNYMGHNCIKHTLYYFHFVPDFYTDFKEIAKRLESRIPEV